MAVLPESMEQIDPENPAESLKILDEYIRYMGERIEFGMRNMTKSVNAAGISSTELYILLVAMDNRISAQESTVNGLRGTVTGLQGSVSEVQTALAALTVDDANELMRTALREENRAYVQIDPAE